VSASETRGLAPDFARQAARINPGYDASGTLTREQADASERA